MIKINLLPYHEKEKKENLARQVFMIAGTFVIFILCLVWVQVWMYSSVKDLEGQIGDSETTITVLNKKIGDLERFKRDKEDLEQKLSVIKTLEENRLAPVKTLDDLAMLVPLKNIWLINITQKNNLLNL